MATTQGPGQPASATSDRPYPGPGAIGRSDADRGTSLIEILVSVVLLGLVGTGVLMAFGMATRGSALSGELAEAQSALTAAHDVLAATDHVGCGDDPLAVYSAAVAVADLDVRVDQVEQWHEGDFVDCRADLDDSLQRITLTTGDGGHALEMSLGPRAGLPHLPPPPQEPDPVDPPPTDDPDLPVPVCSVTEISPNRWWRDVITVEVSNTTEQSYEQDEWRVELVYPGSGYPQNEGHYDWEWRGDTLQLVPSGTWLHLHHGTDRDITVLEPPGSMSGVAPTDIGCRIIVERIVPVFEGGRPGASCAVTAHQFNPHWQDQLTVTVTNRTGAPLRYHHWMTRLSYAGSGTEPNGHYSTTWDGDRVTFVPMHSWIEIPNGGTRQFVIREPAGSTAHLSAAEIPCIVGVPR